MNELHNNLIMDICVRNDALCSTKFVLKRVDQSRFIPLTAEQFLQLIRIQ